MSVLKSLHYCADTESLAPLRRGYCQELRLAVVMYGGVSLAIYMNGVAQEILRLVRATAVAPDPNPWRRAPLLAKPEGTEKVYRRLGQILRRHAPPATDTPDDPTAPIYSNVVVDVVSGTSAGGINGVFHAKALATDTSLDSLRDLWMDEAAIERLVNDAGSLEDAPSLDAPDPPRSLLNARRLHLRLVEALDGMDPPGGPEKPPSPYVDQLDLFVTATDLHGTALPLRLADGIVWERRYRNVFHFRYDWDPALDRKRTRPVNDFDAGGDHPERNHRLAFAARATSSFPFAFEPMTLEQAVDGDDPRWGDFFRERLAPKVPPEREKWALPEKRAFGDGGLLDNKPFSYAIDRIVSRFDEGVMPVDRKLLYVEPAPTTPEDDSPPERPPDALGHVALALGALPRHEAIREDLQRILDRNRLAKWVDRILERMEEDVRHVEKGPVPDRAAFAEKGLAEMRSGASGEEGSSGAFFVTRGVGIPSSPLRRPTAPRRSSLERRRWHDGCPGRSRA